MVTTIPGNHGKMVTSQLFLSPVLWCKTLVLLEDPVQYLKNMFGKLT